MTSNDTDDYNNLERLMRYLQGSISLPLILSIDKYGNINCYIDVSFVANKYIRSHTGGFMTLGSGVAYVQYIKQKLNTKS